MLRRRRGALDDQDTCCRNCARDANAVTMPETLGDLWGFVGGPVFGVSTGTGQ